MVSKIKTLFDNQSFLKYFKNTSWLFLERIIRIFISFLVGIWIARYLGPKQLGLLSYAQSVVAIVSIFASMGLDNVVIRELVKNQKQTDFILGTSFFLKIIGSFFTFIIILLLINISSYDITTQLLLIIFGSSVFFNTLQIIDFYFQSKVLAKYSVYSSLISLILSSIIKILLIIFHFSLLYFAIATFLETFFLALSYLYFYHKQHFSLKIWKINFSLLKSLFKDSWPFILSAFAVVIYMKIDIIMIKEMLNNNAVGQYTIAVRLSEVWNFIPVIISASLFPAIINIKNNVKLYKKRLERLYSLMIWGAVFISILISQMSHFIIITLFGEIYQEAVAVLQIHIWSSIFIFLLVASGKWLVSENLGMHAFYRNLSGAVINIVLNYILLPIYGIIGAAYATLISYAIAGFLYDLIDKRLRESFMMKVNALFLTNIWAK